MSALPKRALKDPRGWVAERTAALGMSGPVRDGALRDAEALAPLANRLREFEERRGRTSREIGAAKSSGADTAPLVSEMRNVVAEARAVERDLRSRLESLLAPDDRGNTAVAAPVATVPRYFNAARGSDASLDAVDALVSPVDSALDRKDYTRYLHAHPARTAYHELGLRDLIAYTNDQRSHHLIARSDDGTVRGLLPLVRLRTSLFGDYFVSVPWFNYGGPLADDAATSEALMRAASELARDYGCSHMEIRETAPREGWTARTDKVSMTLALPDNVDALEKSFGTSLRAQSNKAERAGCTFHVGGRELLDDFYRVFSINMRDLGTPVQSLAFYDALLELFEDDAFLAVVSRDGEPLAAGFLLAHGGETLEIPWASSLRKTNPLGVNMMLYRRTLGEAVARGYRHFDFGRSTMGGPTWRFKKQWGAQPRQLYWHYWTADGADMTGPSADSPKFRLAIAAWRRMPIALTRRLGPTLVRGLP